jgi:transcriptional regulator with XRE-family HTH domain
MDYSAIGKKIVQLRKMIGLTQKDLAKGICTQGLISRMEKGDIYPNAFTLYQIANKLGVDCNYFFEVGSTPRLDYILKVERQLNKYRKNLQYEEMMEIVRREENNPLFTSNSTYLQLLLWHRGIYENEVMDLTEEAIITLDKALEINRNEYKALSEREMEIMLSKGVMYFHKKEYEEALNVYNQIHDSLKKHPQLNDIQIKTKLYYNTARVLSRMERYNESLSMCKKGISWCLSNESMYLIGELNYHYGYNAELEGDLETAVQYMKKAEFILNLEKKEVYTSYIKDRLEKLHKKSEERKTGAT